MDHANQLDKDLNRFVVEGSLNTVFGTFIGGTFLVGFALSLGAEDSHIGVLASLPPLLNLVQIAGSYLVSRVGSAKTVCLAAALGFRAVWLLILLAPWLLLRTELGFPILLLLIGIGAASLFASLSGIAWMSWITPLVPEDIRGKFFGHRSMVASAVGMVAALFAGRFIDWWQQLYPEAEVTGFSWLFLVGTVFGVAGWVVLSRISDYRPENADTSSGYLLQLREPFRHPGFRKWMGFSVLWSFAVGIGSPFFSVFMITNLGLPFSLIALLGLVSGVTNTLGMRLWGGLLDEIGSKPLLLLCSLGGGAIPILWLLASPENYWILWPIHVLTGIFWSGIGLASSHLLMGTAPRQNSGTYFAVFAGITGLAGAVAPIVGGMTAGLLASLEFPAGPIHVSSLHWIFLVTTGLRLASLAVFRSVPAARDMPQREVLQKLRHLAFFPMARGSQQLVGVGAQSLENSLAFLTQGSQQMEHRMGLLIERGTNAAKYVRSRSQQAERRLDSSVHRWEGFLDTLAEPIVHFGRRIYRFLTQDDDDKTE